ncbi:MAG: amidohydrolase [Anaerovoracaceae bacterium]|jgi:predicted amidohydrolase YtcJ
MNSKDIILISDAVFTGLQDTCHPGAVVVRDNKIAAVLTKEELAAYPLDHADVYRFQDRMIMPGLIDGHQHLWWGAVSASPHMLDVTASTSEEDCIEMIRAYAEANPQEKRIRGFGWFPANWGDAPLPTRRTLDKAVPDRPAYFMCADEHTCWMNKLALEESGYSPDMELAGGSVGTFDDGEMNGLVFEPDAMIYAWANLYAFPDDEVEEIMRQFMAGLASQGVTAISEMNADDYDDVFHHRYEIFRAMADRGEFTSRVHVYTKLMGYTDFTTACSWQKEFNTDIFRINGLKGFMDGVTSTYTGALLEPYTDRPDTCGDGVPLTTQEALDASVIAANAAGLPVRLHCIGGKAVRMALNAYEASIKANGRHGLPNSIEHIETVHPDDIPRFAELDVTASMQGEHLSLDANEKIVRMGEERCRWEWPFKSLLHAGANLAFGTDFPVVPYNQFPGIWAAVLRRNYDGTPAGVSNGENLTVAEALRANTLGSARVYGREKELGTLEEGKLADIVVLDRNLFAINADEIRSTKVDLTMMNGRIVYRREGAAAAD